MRDTHGVARINVKLKLLQFLPNLRRTLVALFAVLVDSPTDDFFQPRWNFGIKVAQRRRPAAENAFNDRSTGVAGKRLSPGRHFVEQQTKRKDVGARIQVITANLFGRHIRRSPTDVSDHRDRLLRTARGVRPGECNAFREQFGQTEIEHFGLTALGHENVRRFYIAMNNALDMSGVERVRNLDSEVQYFVERQRLATDVISQTLAVYELHSDEGPVALADVIDCADAGMV